VYVGVDARLTIERLVAIGGQAGKDVDVPGVVWMDGEDVEPEEEGGWERIGGREKLWTS